MKKRLLSILLALALCFGLLPTVALAADGDVDYLYCDANGANWATGTKAAREYILLHLRPMLVNLATARCSNTVSRIVVAAVNDAVEQGWMEYGRLVSFDKDSDGRVTALRSNMAEFNRLQTAVADDVLERLGQVSASELAVPLGTLTGSPLLAGRGPKLNYEFR